MCLFIKPVIFGTAALATGWPNPLAPNRTKVLNCPEIHNACYRFASEFNPLPHGRPNRSIGRCYRERNMGVVIWNSDPSVSRQTLLDYSDDAKVRFRSHLMRWWVEKRARPAFSLLFCRRSKFNQCRGILSRRGKQGWNGRLHYRWGKKRIKTTSSWFPPLFLSLRLFFVLLSNGMDVVRKRCFSRP